MQGKARQLPGAREEKERGMRHWFRTLIAVLDDIMAVTLGGFWAAGSGLAAARTGKGHERRL